MSIDITSPAPPPHATHDQLTQYRLTMIEQTLKAISESLDRLATLEQKHLETRDAVGRAFKGIEKMDERMRVVEMEMPTLKLVRKWVITGILGIVGLLGVTIAKLFSISVG